MKKLIYIDACIRKENSRTKLIADPILKKLGEKYEIDTIDLTCFELSPLNSESYKEREKGNIPPLAEEYAKKVALADKIVISMPFWDMSFPAVFKVFCEHISLNGITFSSDEKGALSGNCKADKIMLITTRGADIDDFSPLDQSSSYIKAISALWGIGELIVVSAKGTDMADEITVKEKINHAKEYGLKMCDKF